MNTYKCKCPACGKLFPLECWNQRRICLKTNTRVRIVRFKVQP